MSVPKLSLEQRRAALEKATAARRRRADLKIALKKKEISLREVLALSDEEEAIAKMRVIALLEALPRIGPIRAQQLMEDLGIAPNRRIRGLGEIQKGALLRFIEQM